jgi:hypothetical protein
VAAIVASPGKPSTMDPIRWIVFLRS